MNNFRGNLIKRSFNGLNSTFFYRNFAKKDNFLKREVSNRLHSKTDIKVLLENNGGNKFFGVSPHFPDSLARRIM